MTTGVEETPRPGTVPASATGCDSLVEELSQLWAQVIGIESIPCDASFAELGGSSLHASRLVARIRKHHGVELPLAELFKARNVGDLARRVTQCRTLPATVGEPVRTGLPPVLPGSATDAVPSLSQQRLWFLDHLNPTAGVAYNVSAVTRLSGPLDLEALRAAWGDVGGRHEQFSTSFRLVDGRLRAKARPVLPAVQYVDLSDRPDPHSDAMRRAEQLAADHIDLGEAPLTRCTVFRLDDQDHLMALVLHHVIADGRTVDILDRDLARAYRARRAGQAWQPPAPDLEYRDFARWQHELASGPAIAGLLAHWHDRLDGAPTVLDLPADHQRPAVRSHQGRRITRRTRTNLLTGVHALAAATRTTPYAVCLAAYGALLGELTGRRDLLVASPTDGRPDPALEEVVGFFANTVPVRLHPATGSFREQVVRAHTSVLDALEHQYVPFELLAREFVPAGDLSRPPLAQVALAYQGPRRAQAELSGVKVQPLALDNGTAKFDLTVEIHEDGAELELTAEFSTDLFTEQRSWGMLDRYLDLLTAAVEQPDLRPDGPIGPRGSGKEPVAAASTAERDAPDWHGSCLHEIFADAAACQPDSIAVTDGTRRLTYADLDRAANRLAHRLRRSGVGPEHLVGLCAERTVDLVVGVLGVLKAGAGYLPLDPRHPTARLEATLDDAGCRVLVGDAELCAPLLGSGRTLLSLAEPFDDEPDHAPDTGVSPGNAAYVIYTSGSTGRPKGVVVTHANATRLFTSTKGDFGFGPDDVWTMFHSIAFDFSVWELWGPLLYGGRLVLVPYMTSRDPLALLDLLSAERVTVLNQTPTAFRQLAAAAEDAGFPRLALRVVVFGGEALDPAMLRGWVGGYGSARPRLVNMYGITETTVHVTVRPIGVEDLAGSISPIGHPISDLRVHLLDEDMQEVPPGVEGEMYIGGAGVARGYLNRPDLTRERFVPDPFGAPGDRLYRSGDLAVRLPDGQLEYRGRADQQVKLHGFRIELGEVERALLDHAGVRSAACVLREDIPGLPRLVAYLVAPAGRTLDTEVVRAALAERLPAHMVPSAFVQVAALPATANGKLDRAMLPAPSAGPAVDTPARVTARTATEQVLAEVWSQVLGVEQPDVHENFFALGGDSIVAIRLGAAARAAGLPATIEQIFRFPTISELAAECDRSSETEGSAEPGEPQTVSTSLGDLPSVELPPEVTDAYPMAAMQLAILYECELAEDDEAGLYHDLLGLWLDGPFDAVALERALAVLCRRHEILRTSFHLGRFREPMQLVHQYARIPLTVDDRGAGDAGSGQELGSLLRDWWTKEKADPFSLGEPPLVRCHVLCSGARFHLALAVHHIAFDGWSLARLMTELLLEYDAQLGSDKTVLVPMPATRYRDFVAAEQAALADPATVEFWQAALADPDPADALPVLPGGGTDDESAFHAVLPSALEAGLSRLAGELGLPLKSVFLAAHMWALQQLSGDGGVTTGIQVNGRPEQDGADMVLGLMLNMLPLRVTADGGSWADLARAVFSAERERQPFRRYPLAVMQQSAGQGRSLFEVAFNFTDFHAFGQLGSMTRVRTGAWWFSDRHSFPLMVEITRSPQSGERAVTVSAGVGSPLAGTGARLGELILQALRSIAAEPHAALPTADGGCP